MLLLLMVDIVLIQFRSFLGLWIRFDMQLSNIPNNYIQAVAPSQPLLRITGEKFPLPANWQKLVLDEYKILAGAAAMGLLVDPEPYFSVAEYNSIWSCFNLSQYLQRSSSTLSTLPSEITSRLLLDLITTADEAVKHQVKETVCLRFGHAETLMPLLSQLHLDGCYYMTNYFDTVSQHWRDFDIVPMAANLQMIVTRTSSHQYYIITLLNERPITLIPGDSRIILPYQQAREYLTHCLPLSMQP